MKVRNGFVSNSSSSSFIMFIDKQHTEDTIIPSVIGFDNYGEYTEEIKEELVRLFKDKNVDKELLIELIKKYIDDIIYMTPYNLNAFRGDWIHCIPSGIALKLLYVWKEVLSFAFRWNFDEYVKSIITHDGYENVINEISNGISDLITNKLTKKYIESDNFKYNPKENTHLDLTVKDNNQVKEEIKQLAEKFYNILDLDKYNIKYVEYSGNDGEFETIMEYHYPFEKLPTIKINNH